MNGIARVKAVLDGRQADRVPLGFYVADCDTVSAVIGHETYVRDKVAQQIAFWEGRWDEVAESLKKDTVEFYRKVDLCDIVTHKESVLPSWNDQPTKARKVDATTWEDDQGRVFKVSELSNEFVCVEDPSIAAKEFTLADFPEDDEPAALDLETFEAFDAVIASLGSQRFMLGSGSLGTMPLLGGMERGMMAYVADPDLVRAAIRHHVRCAGTQDAERVRPGQHGILFEEDHGTTRSPMISPAMFREFCLPGMTARCKSAKRYVDHAFLHSCGNTWPLIEMFIDAGITCYQSLQTGAGMDIDKLRESFGPKMTFWGGIAVEILVKGTVGQVRENVRWACGVAKEGGVILGPSHSIAYGVPYENFMAMLDEFDGSSTM